MTRTQDDLLFVLEKYTKRYDTPKFCIFGHPRSDVEEVGTQLFGKAESNGYMELHIITNGQSNIILEQGDEQFYVYCLRPGTKNRMKKQFEQIRHIKSHSVVATVLYSGLNCSKRALKRCYQEALKEEIYPFRVDPVDRKSTRDQVGEIYNMAASLFHIPDEEYGTYPFPGNKDLDDKRRLVMRKIIPIYAMGAVAIGGIPIPFSDAFLLIPEQTTMAVHILSLFGAEDVRQVISPIISSTVLSLVGRSLAGSLLKSIPGVGSIPGAMISGSIAGIFTWGLGMALCEIGYRYSYALKMGKKVDIKNYIQADELKKLTVRFMKQIKEKKISLPLLMKENPTH